MPEEFPYNLKKAQEEAAKIQAKIKSGEAKDYNEAEKLVESEEVEKKKIILTPEQQEAKQRLIKRLSDGYINGALEIKEKFSLPQEFVQDAAKQGFIRRLSNGDINGALEIIEKFSLPQEFILSPEFQDAAKQEFIMRLSKGNIYIYGALEIKEKFSLPQEVILSPEVQDAAKQRLIRCLSKGDIDYALKIREKFSLPQEFILSPEVQDAAKKGLIRCLSKGDIDEALTIKEKFSLPQEFVQNAAKQELIKCLFEGYSGNALKIRDEFNVSITYQEIIEEIPAIEEFLNKIKSISPDFYNQAQKSIELLILLSEFIKNQDDFFSKIKENPFLLEAVSANHRFGSKLLIKYPQFDQLSKENIQFLFAAKKEILTNNPEIDPESVEFRQLMQEKLKKYGENEEILAVIKESGININQWLNYSETRYFNLESAGSHLAFSETIQTPINRIKETLDSYAYTLKNVLKEYRKELSEFKIPLESSKEIEEKISQMQIELEKAKAEGDERKAQGIEKGIAGLKNKMENIKTTALWDKLLGDISAFQRLKNDVFSAQEKLIQAENNLQEKLSGKMPPGKIIQELKEKINQAKEELCKKFSVLERRIENFKYNLLPLLTPALGQERSEALIQEIEQNLAEQFDHWNMDRNTLANLFSERSDKEKSKLENQPMSIFVWARNPDIDLYQGNYSPCCICIDSAHMGAESTIADYNTDLGIQIVNIWDETKNEPVTAAWCWLGKNEKGETALVVDNIESNTQYSTNYPEQLTQELFDYLKKYAQAIGVKKIVLGKDNNDLPTAEALAKMKNDEYKYDKIGGYNREDRYYLEAEDKSVKLIWEIKEKVQKSKEKAQTKKESIKVKFDNIEIKNLEEKDLTAIKNLEKIIYAKEDPDLIMEQAMIEDIKKGNGLEYSLIASEKRPGKKEIEPLGYIVAVEDETDEGDPCIYLEDIALLPEAQGQQIGWELMKNLINKLKEKAKKENKPILLDMHLRENSQRFFERYHNELEQMNVKLIEEALVPDYYDENEDALYKVYQIKVD